jgi:hypothetical protein
MPQKETNMGAREVVQEALAQLCSAPLHKLGSLNFFTSGAIQLATTIIKKNSEELGV